MSEGFKIFVSNIPYDCSVSELTNLLNKYSGFKEITLNIDSTGKPRGNGIALFDSRDNGFKLLEVKNLEVNGRILKFFKFINKKIFQNNILYVDNLPDGTQSVDLKETLEKNYGLIGRCFVNKSKSGKTSATVDIKDDSKFKQALDDKTLSYNDTDIHIKKYINKNVNIKIPSNLDKTSRRNAFISGFHVGRKYGFNECHKMQNKKTEC